MPRENIHAPGDFHHVIGPNGSSQLQSFVAPAGSTRLFLGIPDGFWFQSTPGACEDNDGSYMIRIGVNENPNPVPEPATLALVAMGIAGMAFGAWRKKSN